MNTPVTTSRSKSYHPTVEAGRWQTLSLSGQLGNVGSEVFRASHWRERNDHHSVRLALDRALELMDLTITDPRWNTSRKKELITAREVLCDFFIGDNIFKSTAISIQKYFDYFALVARKDR